MMQTTVPALVIRRTYAASPQRVYEAWTNPELAKQFLCPAGVTIGEVKMDVRPGGTYKIEMLHEEHEPYVAYGTYKEVVPASRLVMTWRWEEENPADEHDTLLTVEFNAHDSGTELILTHENLANLESRANHEQGWTSMLEKLDDLR
jgi:uncharacterized protein YndB with AHSA1/START domain